MADLAKLVVRLEAQSAQFYNELQKVNTKLGTFEKQTLAALSRVDKQFRKFGSGVRTALGFLAGAVSFRAIIKASDEAAANFAQLENAIENAGSAAGGRTAQEFARVSEELEGITTNSDDAIQGVQQLLLRFQNIRTDRFDEATKSVLDLSAALGKDLDTAAQLVGRALSDPEKGMTALARAGVVLSDSQKKVIKELVETGRRAEAQGVLLDALEKKFGGAAEAARNTFGGALKGVQNALNNLLEVDGGLPQATESLNELSKVLQDPGVRAGADALFSVIVRGAAAAAELIGKTIAGLAILLGYGQDAAVNLDNEIIALSERIDDLKKKNPFPDAFTKGQIDEQTAALRKLTAQYEKLMGLGVAGVETAKNGGKKPQAASGAIELPDIEVIDGVSTAVENARKKLEEQGRALTETLVPYERYVATVKDADELLKAGVITQDVYLLQVVKARDELEALSKAVQDVNDRYIEQNKTLEENLELLHQETVAGFDDLIQLDLDNILKDSEEAIGKVEKELDVFSKRAAENTQDILADGILTGIHEGFDEGAEGALESFGKMLEQMAAQALAADIAGKIFGEDGAGGGWLDKGLEKLKGLFGGGGGGSSGSSSGGWDWLSDIGGIFGFGGSRDNGGHARAGEAVMIGRGAQPEMFVPDVAGDMYPKGSYPSSGGGGVVQNIYTSSPITQRSARQLELEASKRQRIASARLG